MSAIETVLWPGLRALEPTSQLGGILARKPGYHNSRDHLPPDDYSVRLPLDQVGPADEGSAIDWTFPEAKNGDYRRIAYYSKKLYVAGQTNDPRAYPLREFFGNTDGDTEVEGWDYAKNRPASSDKSHLWHIHKSIHRKFINSTDAMHSILSILSDGDDTMDPSARKTLITEIWARDTNPDTNVETPAWVAIHEIRTTLIQLRSRIDGLALAQTETANHVSDLAHDSTAIQEALQELRDLALNSGVTQEMLDLAVRRALRSIPE